MHVLPNLAKILLDTPYGYAAFATFHAANRIFHKYNLVEAKVASADVPSSKVAKLLCSQAVRDLSLGSRKQTFLLEEVKSFAEACRGEKARVATRHTLPSKLGHTCAVPTLKGFAAGTRS